MTSTDILIWFSLIFAADIIAMIIYDYIQRKRNEAKESVLCDVCHRPRKLKRTFDKKLWVCRKCNTLYLQENRGN